MMTIWAIRTVFQKTFIFFQPINDTIQKTPHRQPQKKNKNIKKEKAFHFFIITNSLKTKTGRSPVFEKSH
jgi:hypothetical protein